MTKFSDTDKLGWISQIRRGIGHLIHLVNQ